MTRAAAGAACLAALAAMGGCASGPGEVSRAADEASPAAMVRSAPRDISPLAGTWRGTAFEMPAPNVQGIRPVTLVVYDDGTWIATSGRAQCGAGVVAVRGHRVILEPRQRTLDPCVPHSLEARDGHLWGVFQTAFGGRTGSATIDFERAGVPAGR
jgi:hypothetical protein